MNFVVYGKILIRYSGSPDRDWLWEPEYVLKYVYRARLEYTNWQDGFEIDRWRTNESAWMIPKAPGYWDCD